MRDIILKYGITVGDTYQRSIINDIYLKETTEIAKFNRPLNAQALWREFKPSKECLTREERNLELTHFRVQAHFFKFSYFRSSYNEPLPWCCWKIY